MSDVAVIIKDTRYSSLTLHDLLTTRANMISKGGYSKYELSCLQYWIMVKDGRLSN